MKNINIKDILAICILLCPVILLPIIYFSIGNISPIYIVILSLIGGTISLGIALISSVLATVSFNILFPQIKYDPHNPSEYLRLRRLWLIHLCVIYGLFATCFLTILQDTKIIG